MENWKDLLQKDKDGNYYKTLHNVIAVLKYNEEFGNFIAYDEFQDRLVFKKDPPWVTKNNRINKYSKAYLKRYMETYYFRPSDNLLEEAIHIVGMDNKFNSLKDYFIKEKWDGVPRLEKLFIEYLGATDTPYSREVTKKMLVACVARGLDPGTKFDQMLILFGGQGIGKSMLLSKLAGKWYADSLPNIKKSQEQKLYESLTGKIIVEVPELAAFQGATEEEKKSFITKESDFYRKSYADTPEDHPRTNILVGTTNKKEILKDVTGERRYWILECCEKRRIKMPWIDFDKNNPKTEELIHQIWAEAYHYHKVDEYEYFSLSEKSNEVLKMYHNEFQEIDPWEPTIINFLELPYNPKFKQWSLGERQTWIKEVDNPTSKDKLNKICAKLIAVECLGIEEKNIDKKINKRINNILSKISGWEATENAIRFTGYGTQRGFIRKVAKESIN